MTTLRRALAAEALGGAFLLMAVVGSGIMAERLSGGNVALALLANTIATAAALIVLITICGPVSGAHFNPVVSLVFWLKGALPGARALAYVAAQMAGAIFGVWLAHLMFGEPIFQLSTRLRGGLGLEASEFVAAFGLIGVILGTVRYRPDMTAAAVGLYIAAAYWFTASTSFANPAVTLARALSDTFAGIAPVSAPAFIVSQTLGALAAWAVFEWLFKEAGTCPTPP